MNNNIKSISFMDISINGGFWRERQKIVAETTIYSIWERFKETGRFGALNFIWKEGEPNRPHLFWDSDIAKWVESAACVIAKGQDDVLEKAIDDIVESIEKHQDKSGYFNSYFLVVEPDQIWKKRTEHELYCAGHLIEAAVAYYKATGKDKFLNLMRKYADHIEKVFKIDNSAVFMTCGHEEIELALVRLYHCTGEIRYLELSKFFIDNRGRDPKEQYYSWANAPYAQYHLPVREQRTAEGHAVRASYLYCGMADIALEYGDKELLNACREIFENIVRRRMYVTGGIGSSPVGEAFTIDYDLPNLTAYTESCAAIGFAFFARRMLNFYVDSIYTDNIERVLYNGFLSSISLDGKSFFYENPLEIHPELINSDVSVNEGKRKFLAIQRKEVFDCSCCPPNITRFIASIGDFLYTYDEKTLYVHHYMSSKTETKINGIYTEITQQTNYPIEGNISFNINGNSIGCIAFRIPYWCDNFSLSVNGKKSVFLLQNGYAYLELAKQGIMTVDIIFNMKIQLIEASPMVQENSGRVALQRGPVIYCLEAMDNGNLLRDVRVDKDAQFELVKDEYFGIPVIKTTGYRRKIEEFEYNLYKPLEEEFEKVDLKFVPYFAFANRGVSEMIVWVLMK